MTKAKPTPELLSYAFPEYGMVIQAENLEEAKKILLSKLS